MRTGVRNLKGKHSTVDREDVLFSTTCNFNIDPTSLILLDTVPYISSKGDIFAETVPYIYIATLIPVFIANIL